MQVDLIMKGGTDYYTGTLVGIDGTKVLLQTIPLPGAKPSEFDLSNVEAFHNSAGIFAYDRRTRKFVPALTYYSLNKATGTFDRTASAAGDTLLADHAKILGPTKSAWALLGVAADGSLSVGLPVPAADSPQTIPAANFQRIVTPDGVYTYDPATRGYTYQSHTQIAQAAQRQRDAAGQAAYQQLWDRHVQEYQLYTNAIHAAQPYYAPYWTGGPTWPWWRTQQGPGPAPQTGSGKTPPP
jgi:hypothetical protein